MILAANWKMNHLRADATHYANCLQEGLSKEDLAPETRVLLFPPAPLLAQLVAATRGLAPVAVGAQDVHEQARGAHTGELSAELARDVGCRYALCGHSERRQGRGAGTGESDEVVVRKLEAATQAELTGVLCVGESLEDREASRTQAVLDRQLEPLLASDKLRGAAYLVAYEPVWAIGTGQTATPELAQETHAFLRSRLGERALLYGGSVKPQNCEALAAQPDIDGFLVGGAGLDPNSFLDIICRCGRATT